MIVPESGDSLPKSIFNKVQIIPKYCFGCYKIQIDLKNVLELMEEGHFAPALELVIATQVSSEKIPLEKLWKTGNYTVEEYEKKVVSFLDRKSDPIQEFLKLQYIFLRQPRFQQASEISPRLRKEVQFFFSGIHQQNSIQETKPRLFFFARCKFSWM